jgi:hypothetical protein
MQKLLLMSVMFVPVLVPIWLSRKGSAARGLRRTTIVTTAFLIGWALIGPRLFFLFPAE